jgi:hypothetical protein
MNDQVRIDAGQAREHGRGSANGVQSRQDDEKKVKCRHGNAPKTCRVNEPFPPWIISSKSCEYDRSKPRVIALDKRARRVPRGEGRHARATTASG